MVSLLDCIERVPLLMENIIEKRHENIASLFALLDGHLDSLKEIVFVGSGTSNTAAVTSKFFVEKVSGIKTTVVYPTDFCHNTFFYDPCALYVFTSQTGTSTVVRRGQKIILDKGYHAVSITESPDTPIARQSRAHIDMGCGKEEYLTRVIGYSTSVFTHMLMGLELGLHRGTITRNRYDDYIRTAEKVPDSYRAITPRAMQWMDKVKRQMLRSRCIVFTGAGALQGVALEAAVKIWEIPQRISIGYELEEGLHGANYGYNYNHCVVVLNNGGIGSDKALGLARWMKDVYKNSLVIGSEVVDSSDFKIDLAGGDFDVLELAPVVQIIAYRLAHDEGRDLFAPHDNSVMESYFRTHDE